MGKNLAWFGDLRNDVPSHASLQQRYTPTEKELGLIAWAKSTFKPNVSSVMESFIRREIPNLPDIGIATSSRFRQEATNRGISLSRP